MEKMAFFQVVARVPIAGACRYGVYLPDSVYAIWQHIVDDCYFDFTELMALAFPETLFGRIVPLGKWPILTR
jgi:hypothetical protein